MSEIPGVEAVTLASDVPLLGATEIPVVLPDTDAKTTSVAHTIVDPEFFRTLGVPILKGRAFHSGDNGKSPLVMIVNQRLASQLWPGQDPLGRTLEAGETPRRKFVVIGVVTDGRHLDLNEDPKPFFYLPLAQNDRPGLSIVARTKGDPRLWVGQIAQALRGLGLKILVNPVTFEEWLNLSLFGERFTAAAVAALSGFGLLLALLGLFASISYSVRERRKELGLRVALGATQTQLLQLILRQIGVVAGWGVLSGVALGVAATSIVRSQLYGIASVEWVVLVPVGLVMLGLCLVVAYASARPWLKVDAMEAVRHA